MFVKLSMISRVLISLGLLGGGKILNVCVPFLFKAAVDDLGALSMTTIPETALATTTAIILGCRFLGF
jgi:ATP-binding cassette, subfamily B (MDR/TAP), member 7